MQLLRYRVKFSRLDAIFITHLHGDHILGLPGLLTSLSLYERNFPLKLFAPAGLKEVLNVVFAQTASYLNYELEFIPTEDFAPGDIIYEKPEYHVRLLPLDHRIYCRGFRFSEVNKRPRFDFYQAKALDIPNQYYKLLKQGNTITLEDGRQITAEEVSLPPELPLSFSYCSDTRYHEALVDHIQDSTLLYHEATFTHDMVRRAASTYHATARQAAQIAEQARVSHLLLGHFSARYKDLRPLLEEAQNVFASTELAKEGQVWDLKQIAAQAGEETHDAT
jgi:ribonuclease Z